MHAVKIILGIAVALFVLWFIFDTNRHTDEHP